MEQREAVKIGERTFLFVRITPNSQKKIMKKFSLTLHDKIAQKLFPSSAVQRDWKKLCRVAFEKNFLWKYFHITPKELRSKNISLKLVGEIQASFFSYFQEGGREYREHLKNLGNSPIQKQQENSAT